MYINISRSLGGEKKRERRDCVVFRNPKMNTYTHARTNEWTNGRTYEQHNRHTHKHTLAHSLTHGRYINTEDRAKNGTRKRAEGTD